MSCSTSSNNCLLLKHILYVICICSLGIRNIAYIYAYMYREIITVLLTNIFRTFSEFAESDSFFCFMNLMSEIRDFFIKTLDESAVGIGL